jgi:hypothetical protein
MGHRCQVAQVNTMPIDSDAYRPVPEGPPAWYLAHVVKQPMANRGFVRLPKGWVDAVIP